MLTWRRIESLLGDGKNGLPEQRFEERLADVLTSWVGTPYMLGQQAKGMGVDCVRFVCGVLDEFYRRPPTPIETLPPDTALHAPQSAIRAVAKIVALYQPNFEVTDGCCEPGDVLVMGPAKAGPAHAAIVGAQPNTLWHASPHGVARTGIRMDVRTKTFNIYRMKDRTVAC